MPAATSPRSATRAVRDGDDWIVNGTKVWTSGAADADWCYVIARTDPDAPPHAGLSELIVDLHAPRHLDLADQRHDRQPPLLRGRLHRRAGAGRQPGRRGERQLPPGHAPDGARARRHRPPRQQPGALRRRSARAPTRPTRWSAKRSPPSRSGYRIGRHLVLREVLGQAPAGFSAATKTFCTEFEQRVADFCCPGGRPRRHARPAGLPATAATPPPTRSWAAPRTSCATSWASGCSTCLVNPADDAERVRPSRGLRESGRTRSSSRTEPRSPRGWRRGWSGTRLPRSPRRSSR